MFLSGECPHMLPSLPTLVLLKECWFFTAMSEEQILKVGGGGQIHPFFLSSVSNFGSWCLTLSGLL